MKEVDPKVQRIINWRESMATLPDTHFFEIIRMYLGEIHTPFNKTKLVEELGSFLRKEEHRRTIVSLLSPTDRELLAAVWHIKNATQEKLATFFMGDGSFAKIYEQLLNLEERLLIYRHVDKQLGKTIISINPMLEEVLTPLLTPAVLLPEVALAELNWSAPQQLSPELLASYACFLLAEADVCKADGTFKKRIATQLEALFPGQVPLLQQITFAFINLLILKDAGSHIELDRARLEKFAELDEVNQYTLLCVAAHGRFSRTGMTRQMQLLLAVASKIGAQGIGRKSLLRLAFLISEKDSDIPGVAPVGRASRFSALLAANAEQPQSFDTSAVSLIDRLLDTAVAFGILLEQGKDENGEGIYTRGLVLTQAAEKKQYTQNPDTLTVDAGFSVTLLPGKPLSALLPLMNCMELRQFDTVPTFEITKKAVMRSFDRGFTQESLLALLSENSAYELPQNLAVCLEDWSSAYNAAAVYKGYILKVSAEQGARIEKNRKLLPDIALQLAPGMYLLNAENDTEAALIMRRSGLDFYSAIKGVEKTRDVLSFPQVSFVPASDEDCVPEAGSADTANMKLSEADGSFDAGSRSGAEATCAGDAAHDEDAYFAAMYAALDTLNLLPEQKEGLADRIQRKIIVDTAQLRGDSVRLERLEASGMDYGGKLHIIDSAMSSNSMLELAFENPEQPAGDSVVVVGVPLELEKFDGDALLHLELIPQHEEKVFSVGKARLVKKIRGSILR